MCRKRDRFVLVILSAAYVLVAGICLWLLLTIVLKIAN